MLPMTSRREKQALRSSTAENRPPRRAQGAAEAQSTALPSSPDPRLATCPQGATPVPLPQPRPRRLLEQLVGKAWPQGGFTLWESPQFQGGFTLWDLPCVLRYRRALAFG